MAASTYKHTHPPPLTHTLNTAHAQVSASEARKRLEKFRARAKAEEARRQADKVGWV